MNRRSFLGGLLALLVARKLPRPQYKLPKIEALSEKNPHAQDAIWKESGPAGTDQTSIWLLNWSNKDPASREFYEYRWSGALSPPLDWKKEWEIIRKKPNWFKRSIRGI